VIEAESYGIRNLRWPDMTVETAAYIYTFHWTGQINGHSVQGNGRGTTILRKAGDGWLVAHEHLSRGGLE